MDDHKWLATMDYDPEALAHFVAASIIYHKRHPPLNRTTQEWLDAWESQDKSLGDDSPWLKPGASEDSHLLHVIPGRCCTEATNSMGSLLCGTTFTCHPLWHNQRAVFERAVHRNHIEAMLLLRVRAVSYYRKCT
jgi:hypothetical protein